jgi:hypothetical protein
MSDRGSAEDQGPEAEAIAELRRALERAEKSAKRELHRSRKWEREAVFRASTVAAQLATQILAAHRLANAVERHLGRQGVVTDPGSAAIREALTFYKDARAE